MAHFIVLGIVVLLIDLLTPLEYFDWLLYWVLISAASKYCDKYKTYYLALLYSALIVLGLVLGDESYETANLINHLAGIVILWVITYNLVSVREKHRAVLLKQKEICDIYDRVDEILFGLDTEWRVTYKNAAADRYGYTFVNNGDFFFEKMPALLGTDFELNLKKAMATQTRQSFLYETRYSTTPRIMSFTVYPSEEGLSVFTKDLTDTINARREAEQATSNFQTIVERIDDAFWAVDSSWTVVHANEKMIALSGKSKDEILYKNYWDALPFLKGTLVEEKFHEAMGKQKPVRFEYKLNTTPPGYLALSVHPSEKGLTIFAQDITDYKDTKIKLEGVLREREFLLKEVFHRVKNNLQIVTSIINLNKEYTKDPKTITVLDSISGRIQSISLLHSKLQDIENISRFNASDYLRDIIQFLSAGYKKQDAVLKLELEDLILDTQKAISLGIIVNELVSNSFKHACSEEISCVIKVKLEQNNGNVHLVVQDNGKGYPPSLHENNSFGMDLVKHFVEMLDGRMTIKDMSGARVEVIFPLK